MVTSKTMELVDLRNNPLSKSCHDILSNANVTFRIDISKREKEDWEDLSI